MKRILIVDDEPALLQGVKVLFHPMRGNWELALASRGDEALDTLRRNGPFDIVISGMHMPGMHGADLLESVRDAYPETVRFAFSGNLDTETVQRAARVAHQVLAKPCEPNHLRNVIARALTLRDRLRDAKIRHAILDVASLPCVPALYHEISREIAGPDPSVDRVARLIEQDPGMSAKVLQIVNSAYMGLRHEVRNIHHAAALLGLENIKTIVLLGEVFALAERAPGKPPLSLDALWRHVLNVGLYARHIAELENAPRKMIDDSYTAGLLHDVGLLLLVTKMPEELKKAVHAASNGAGTLHEAEKEIFGATHAEIGGYLLDLWGLPEAVVRAIAYHFYPRALEEDRFDPDEIYQFGPVAAVHAANYLAGDQSLQGYEFGQPELDAVYIDRLGLSEHVSIWWDRCVGAKPKA